MPNLRPAGVAVAILLVVAGCTSGKPEATRPSPSTSPVASAAPGEQVLAVITAQGALELYAVGPKAAAHRLGVLPGPAGAKARDVTLSAGAAPRVCATWGLEATTTLRCYDGGSTRWQDIPIRDESPTAVGLSVSGKGLAWSVAEPRDASQVLVVQRTPGGPVTRFGAYPKPDPEDVTLVVSDIAWAGEDTLLVTHSWDADVNGTIAQVDLDAPPRGWTNAPSVDTSRGMPVAEGAPSSTGGGTVLATLLGWDDEGRETWEAVELRLGKKGGVASVVSVPSKGRRMRSVSGGPNGVLYQTESDADVRTYWRAPGQAHGARVTGLPADAVVVLAQP